MTTTTRKLRKAFDHDALARVCTMSERVFPLAYDMDIVQIDAGRRKRHPDDNWYAHQDNGSSILAVAHLDTVAPAHTRACGFLDTAAGEVVYSRALDDRLGAYIILDWLPALGIRHDVLLTVGEEDGQSTAEFFEPQKQYDWIIEFDRGGTDVVMYQYEDDATADAVEASGARVGRGIFSDIGYLEHLDVKAFNWGVGYRDYHGPRAHAYLDDTTMMMKHYLRFHEAQAGKQMPHVDLFDVEARDDSAWWNWDDDKWEPRGTAPRADWWLDPSDDVSVPQRCRDDEEPDLYNR